MSDFIEQLAKALKIIRESDYTDKQYDAVFHGRPDDEIEEEDYDFEDDTFFMLKNDPHLLNKYGEIAYTLRHPPEEYSSMAQIIGELESAFGKAFKATSVDDHTVLVPLPMDDIAVLDESKCRKKLALLESRRPK